MSFLTQESDKERGEPVELYKFVYGTGENSSYCYTNADAEILFENDTYIPVPIGRDAYKVSGKTDHASINIRMPINTDLSNLFLSYPPTQPVIVTIRQGHLNDPAKEFLVVWPGRVLSSSREGDEAVLSCSSTIVSTKRPGLRQNYQYGCPYVLFGGDCKASMVLATMSATVVAVASGGLTLEAGWAQGYPFTDFAGGMLRWTTSMGTEFRSIVKVDPNGVISFIGVLRGVEVGQTVDIIRGCDHQMTGCNKHDNINNYGGQPWIPTKNPVKYHPFW